MSDRPRDKVGIVAGAGSHGLAIGNGKAVAIPFARDGARAHCVDAEVARNNGKEMTAADVLPSLKPLGRV